MYRTLGVTPDADYLEVMEACDRLKVKYADDRKQVGRSEIIVRDRSGESRKTHEVLYGITVRSCHSFGAMFSGVDLKYSAHFPKAESPLFGVKYVRTCSLQAQQFLGHSCCSRSCRRSWASQV